MEINQACVDAVYASFYNVTLPVLIFGLLCAVVIAVAFWPRRKTIDVHLLLTEDEDGNLRRAQFISPKDGVRCLDEARKQRENGL